MEKNVYHITVRNIKTGEIRVDRDATALICVASDGESTQVCHEISCNSTTLVHLLQQTLLDVSRICKQFPKIAALLDASFCEGEEKDEEKDEEEKA